MTLEERDDSDCNNLYQCIEVLSEFVNQVKFATVGSLRRCFPEWEHYIWRAVKIMDGNGFILNESHLSTITVGPKRKKLEIVEDDE